MNAILDMLMNSGGGANAGRLGDQFGLSRDQAGSAMAELVPALLAGLQRNVAQPGGLDALTGALTRGNHGQYLDNPDMLGQESTVADGNSILGHILGSKDASRAVAGRAAEQTGLGADVLKKMLPVVATMVMGGLSRQNAAPQQGAGGLLGSLLDRDGDGSMVDDVAGMLGGFLSGGR